MSRKKKAKPTKAQKVNMLKDPRNTDKRNNLTLKRCWERWEPYGVGLSVLIGSPSFQIFTLFLVLIAGYGHTLDVPFYLDDMPSILENPYIKGISHYKELWQIFRLRFIGYFSFALNYEIHGFDVKGFHIANILIHFCAGCAVFFLIKGITRTPRVVSKFPVSKWVPWCTALIFLLHPLQTQAVTYIVQRLASLSAFFYLAALGCYVWARLGGVIQSPKNEVGGENQTVKTWSMARWVGFAGGGVFAGLAFLTKQNTVTLPVTILLAEFWFFTNNRLRLAVMLLGGIVAGCGGLYVLGMMYHGNPLTMGFIERMTRMGSSLSREAYFLTQLKVVWLYIGLFFFPKNLNLAHDIAIASTIYAPWVIAAAAGHLLVIGIAISSYKKRPFIGYGILFYYVAHSIESGVFPIQDLVFEHRTYLPNLGLSMVCGWVGCHIVFHGFDAKNGPLLKGGTALMFLLVVFAGMGAKTYQRNQLWQDPVRFWEESVRLAPHQPRALAELGNQYLQKGETDKAVKFLYRAFRRQDAEDLSKIEARKGPLVNLVVGLTRLGKYEEALAIGERLLKTRMRAADRSKILNNLGNIHFHKQAFDRAEALYRKAVKAFPDNDQAVMNLGSALANQGRFEEAQAFYLKIIRKDHDNPVALHNLKIIKAALEARNE